MEDSIKERYGDGEEYESRVGYQSRLEEIAPAIDDEERLPGSNIDTKSEMDERLEEIMESYSGSDESVSMSVYLEPEKEYGQKSEIVQESADDDGGDEGAPDAVQAELPAGQADGAEE